MKRINYKSDFDFIAKLTAKNANGESVEVGYPDYDFELIITSGATAIPLRSFVASVIGGVVKNCYNDNGLLHVVCNNHNLNVGQLAIEFKSYIPNRIYPDGIQTIVTTQAMDIELVSTDSNTDTVETELQLPIHVMGEGGSPDLSKYLTKTYAEEVYAKTEDIPEKVSELKNDAGYITKDDIPSVELPDNLVTMDELTKYQPKGDYATTDQLNGKQDALTAGDGISIANNVISCTLDTSLYVVVSELPSVGVANKIYLIESNESGEQNIYTEYAYINDEWEKLGQYRAEINLSPYLTKEDAESTYQPKGDYALKTDVPTKTSELTNDSDFATLTDIPDTETYVLNFTIQDGVNTGAYSKDEYDKLRAAIVAGKLIIIGGTVTRVTADSQAMAADYVVIRYSTPRISDDSKSVTISVYELKFGLLNSGDTDYTYASKAIHRTIS